MTSLFSQSVHWRKRVSSQQVGRQEQVPKHYSSDLYTNTEIIIYMEISFVNVKHLIYEGKRAQWDNKMNVFFF